MSLKKNYRILIVDDDATFHQSLRTRLGQHYEFAGALQASRMFELLAGPDNYDLLLLDLTLEKGKDKEGLQLIAPIKEKRPELPIIVVTNDEEIPTVVAAMKMGAENYLPKNNGAPDFELWDELFRKGIEHKSLIVENKALRKEVARYRKKETADFPFIGKSSKIVEIKNTLEFVAQEDPDMTILITGETGTGKEVAARFFHYSGMRREKPFVAVNLSAIQESLLESELFGHVKGAFTGASQAKEGYFRQANGGILMLDEIGDINHDIQIKLLRFLEQKVIRPVGSDKDIRLDVQIVTATHRDLKEMVEQGQFRQDLYMRLKTMEVNLPPLRKRPEDIVLITHFYLRREGAAPQVLSPQIEDLFSRYPWPGNIRELVSTIRSMLMRVKIKRKQEVDKDCLPVEIRDYDTSGQARNVTSQHTSPTVKPPQSRQAATKEEQALLDLRLIEEALVLKNGVKGDAAEYAGLINTDNLRYRIKKHQQKFPHLFDDFPAIKKYFPKIFK